ncbi:hypothetical protein ACFS2C_12300 [Prauserella oleivorans]|uniref:Uncharacterized protein n=1 Tax=Prauserella oleivorans TaxID=1478153 RepID=A0ABW5WAM7_9PSEU
MAQEDALDRLLRAWRDDIDEEPFPVIVDVVLPRQVRRRMAGDRDEPSDPPGPRRTTFH